MAHVCGGTNGVVACLLLQGSWLVCSSIDKPCWSLRQLVYSFLKNLFWRKDPNRGCQGDGKGGASEAGKGGLKRAGRGSWGGGSSRRGVLEGGSLGGGVFSIGWGLQWMYGLDPPNF
jgi:hypothetical protein